MPYRFLFCTTLLCASLARAGEFDDAVQPLLKAHCVRCHGPNKPKAGFDLSNAAGLARGGKNGAPIAPSNLDKSLLWQRVSADEMPPEEPLSDADKEILRKWIAGGATGLPVPDKAAGHWAFARLAAPSLPPVKDASRVHNFIDQHLQAALEAKNLSLGPEADRPTLIRRVAFTLAGLPPTPEEIEAFLHDNRPDAYERLVEHYLASPDYGEHWGKHWLDAVGYADTNGYFGKESDRPHAWRYRDYVVDSLNADKPLDRFIREQLCGDELAGVRAGGGVTPEQRELLIATHLLRNGPDGTDDSAPSPEAMQIDRYAALEGTQQVVYTSLLGLSIKCARCHDHKFEPITQREYYQAQSIFYPAFNPEQWVIPRNRVVHAATTADLAAWEQRQQEITAQVAALRAELRGWLALNRPRGEEIFRDEFTQPAPWVPSPAEAPPAPSETGRLALGSSVHSWLASPKTITWAPAEEGAAVQLTFDLLADRLAPTDTPCEYIGYVLSATNFTGTPAGEGANLLLEGRRMMGGAAIYWIHPGEPRYESIGAVGEAKYEPGRNYGLRITNAGGGKLRIEHLVDYRPEGKPFVLDAKLLPPGPLAFYRYPGRNFAVGNVVVEHFPKPVYYTGNLLFSDAGDKPVSELWSAAAPGDEPPPAPVLIDKAEPGRHCADRLGTNMRIIVGPQPESWLCTKQSFDWTPEEVGRSIQATWDLVADQIDVPGGGKSVPCPHFGYYLGAHNFGRRRPDAGGNLLLDGGVLRPTHVYRDYPPTAKPEPLGSALTSPGHRYGVRVTNIGDGKFHLHHVVDHVPDGAPHTLTAAELPDGAFGFLYDVGRSFVVANVTVAEGDFAKHDKYSPPSQGGAGGGPASPAEFTLRIKQFSDRLQELEKQRSGKPGVEVAWVSDMAPQPPQVFLLKRGLYGQHGEEVTPAGLAALADPDDPFEVAPPSGGTTTGRRLALANWLLKPNSRPQSLIARVRANWIWQHHFGVGLTTTPENFGLSGAKPSNPELLEHLALDLVQSGWSLKSLHRAILNSSAFRQSSAPQAAALEIDPQNRLYWRFPLARLDAESVRDAMLAASGELDPARRGAPIVLSGVDGHGATGEVAPVENAPGSLRRTLYVQRRRNVLPTFLQLFDFPAIAATCAERGQSTVPLQSLAQLNADFPRRRAAAMAQRLASEATTEEARIRRAFTLCAAREPTPAELDEALDFLRDQQSAYSGSADAFQKALADFCQMLFASNLFLYVE